MLEMLGFSLIFLCHVFGSSPLASSPHPGGQPVHPIIDFDPRGDDAGATVDGSAPCELPGSRWVNSIRDRAPKRCKLVDKPLNYSHIIYQIR